MRNEKEGETWPRVVVPCLACFAYSVSITLSSLLCADVDFRAIQTAFDEWRWNPVSTAVEVAPGSKNCKAEAEPLEPGMTYCVRLVLLAENDGQQGPPGSELIVDTEQVGCTPKAGSGCGCCVIQ
jgi:hypothetical protein